MINIQQQYHHQQQQDRPLVLIAGGGPAGLLQAILLDKIGVDSIVVERTKEPDEWNSKSYTLVLGDKGKDALQRAGCLDAALEVGTQRRFIYLYDGRSGDLKPILKQSYGLGLTRHRLVEFLENVVMHCPRVTLKKGSGVSSVAKEENSFLAVTLEDGSVLTASHVIGADGKWSRIRESFPELRSQWLHALRLAYT